MGPKVFRVRSPPSRAPREMGSKATQYPGGACPQKGRRVSSRHFPHPNHKCPNFLSAQMAPPLSWRAPHLPIQSAGPIDCTPTMFISSPPLSNTRPRPHKLGWAQKLYTCLPMSFMSWPPCLFTKKPGSSFKINAHVIISRPSLNSSMLPTTLWNEI